MARREAGDFADALIGEFGSLAGIFSADRAALRRVLPPRITAFMTAMRAAMREALRAPLAERPILSDWQAVIDFLGFELADQREEQFRVLYLDARNHLIRDEAMWRGTIDETPIYVREVLRRALELGAAAMIVAHNHPSGDHDASRSDIEVTRKLAGAGKALGVTLHDHLILGRDGFTSLRREGLL